MIDPVTQVFSQESEVSSESKDKAAGSIFCSDKGSDRVLVSHVLTPVGGVKRLTVRSLKNPAVGLNLSVLIKTTKEFQTLSQPVSDA